MEEGTKVGEEEGRGGVRGERGAFERQMGLLFGREHGGKADEGAECGGSSV